MDGCPHAIWSSMRWNDALRLTRVVRLSSLSRSVRGRSVLGLCYKKFPLLTPGHHKSHLFELESSIETYATPQALYVIYPDNLGNSWRVQTVPISPESFENRKSLPEAWCGLRDAELDAKSGIPGCIFVHASGFTGGNKTRDGALAMARHAIG